MWYGPLIEVQDPDCGGRRYTKRTIVFFQTKRVAHRAAIIFGLAGLKSAELHGNLSQVSSAVEPKFAFAAVSDCNDQTSSSATQLDMSISPQLYNHLRNFRHRMPQVRCKKGSQNIDNSCRIRLESKSTRRT